MVKSGSFTFKSRPYEPESKNICGCASGHPMKKGRQGEGIGWGQDKTFVVSHYANHKKGMRNRGKTGDECRIQFPFIFLFCTVQVVGPYL